MNISDVKYFMLNRGQFAAEKAAEDSDSTLQRKAVEANLSLEQRVIYEQVTRIPHELRPHIYAAIASDPKLYTPILEATKTQAIKGVAAYLAGDEILEKFDNATLLSMFNTSQEDIEDILNVIRLIQNLRVTLTDDDINQVRDLAKVAEVMEESDTNPGNNEYRDDPELVPNMNTNGILQTKIKRLERKLRSLQKQGV